MTSARVLKCAGTDRRCARRSGTGRSHRVVFGSELSDLNGDVKVTRVRGGMIRIMAKSRAKGRIYDRHILLVDDDPEEQELVLLALQRVGIRSKVHSVNSGDEAVAYLKEEGRYGDRQRFPYPSMLITDLKMSDGDGFAILEHLGQVPHHRVVPTIVISASSDADDVKKAHALGASSYFVKPVRFEALERLVTLPCELWVLGERPLVDATGRQFETNSVGKLGERFDEHLQGDDELLGEKGEAH